MSRFQLAMIMYVFIFGCYSFLQQWRLWPDSLSAPAQGVSRMDSADGFLGGNISNARMFHKSYLLAYGHPELSDTTLIAPSDYPSLFRPSISTIFRPVSCV